MPTQPLHLNTPLSKAVFSFFNHLRNDISEITMKPGSIKAYLFGGCALHIHTNARGSNDIDVEFNSAKWLTGRDIVFSKKSVTYQQNGIKRQLLLDTNFSPMLGPLHEDYIENAIRLQTRFNESPLWLYVVTAEDLAISKLGRYSEQDKNDILTLLKKNKMTIDVFENKALEAINYYVGNASATKSHLRQIISLYNKV